MLEFANSLLLLFYIVFISMHFVKIPPMLTGGGSFPEVIIAIKSVTLKLQASPVGWRWVRSGNPRDSLLLPVQTDEVKVSLVPKGTSGWEVFPCVSHRYLLF